MLLQAGRLADSSGPYKLYKLGIKLFVAGMLISMLAPSIWLLVAARGLAAASQALMGPAAVALVIKYGGIGKRIGIYRKMGPIHSSCWFYRAPNSDAINFNFFLEGIVWTSTPNRFICALLPSNR